VSKRKLTATLTLSEHDWQEMARGDATVRAANAAYCVVEGREHYAVGAEAQGAARERRRLRAAIRALRRKWYARMSDAVPGHFDGAARAVQALDEAMRATRKPRRKP
jgi:hypothetical protein